MLTLHRLSRSAPMHDQLDNSIRLEPSSPDPDALQIARLRSALDWMLLVPKWETSLELAILELGFKGRRQGVAFRKAVLSLPIIQKCELLRHALREGMDTLTAQESKRLANLWGITSYRRSASYNRPSAESWRQLCEKVRLRLSARQTDYLAARNELFRKHEHLVASTALPLCKSANRADDGRQEGRIALLQAIDRIDPEQSFEAYARQWIRRRILNFVMTESLPVRVPINLISQSFSQNRETATPASARLLEALRAGAISLDDPSTVTSGACPSLLRTDDSQSPDALAIEANERGLLDAAIESLSDKQSSVLALRFGLRENAAPSSLAQVAKVEGISRQQVAQREKRALRKLATALRQLGTERRPELVRAGD